jgi:hypothetical protein
MANSGQRLAFYQIELEYSYLEYTTKLLKGTKPILETAGIQLAF